MNSQKRCTSYNIARGKKIRCRNCIHYKPSIEFRHFKYCSSVEKVSNEKDLEILRKLVLSRYV